MTAKAFPAHRRAVDSMQQAVFIVFGGAADQPWLRMLRPGFRHCFAVLHEAGHWMVLDPLTARLVVSRLEIPPDFDLPGFYRRAGFTVTGPFAPTRPRERLLPPLSPLTCVSLCRAVLGAEAPFAVTPWGFFRALQKNRKNVLTIRSQIA